MKRLCFQSWSAIIWGTVFDFSTSNILVKSKSCIEDTHFFFSPLHEKFIHFLLTRSNIWACSGFSMWNLSKVELLRWFFSLSSSKMSLLWPLHVYCWFSSLCWKELFWSSCTFCKTTEPIPSPLLVSHWVLKWIPMCQSPWCQPALSVLQAKHLLANSFCVVPPCRGSLGISSFYFTIKSFLKGFCLCHVTTQSRTTVKLPMLASSAFKPIILNLTGDYCYT